MGQKLVSRASREYLDRNAGFTQDQVQYIHGVFQELQDNNGFLDQNKLGKNLHLTDKETEKIFEYLDYDGDGKVDPYEFIVGISGFIFAPLQEKSQILFNLYDFDKSGLISNDELFVLMKTVYSILSVLEAGQSAPSDQTIKEKVKQIIVKWDTDKDSSISLKEFQSNFTKDKNILRALLHIGLLAEEDIREDFGGTDAEVPDCDSDLEGEISRQDADRSDNHEARKLGIDFNVKESETGFELEEVKEGDQFMATKPWAGTVKNSVPSNYKPSKGECDAPEATLELEYIYGYRCHDTRNNLRYTPSGKIVYHSAGVGIILDPKTNTQKFLIQHTDDITCLDIYQNIVVTGQIGKNPLICLWDAETGQELATAVGLLQKGITNVCFSHDGTLIAATAMDDDHHVAIYDVQKLLKKEPIGKDKKNPSVVAFGKGCKANVLHLCFDNTNKIVVAACVKEINFITFAGGTVKLVKGGGWGKNPAQAVLCAASVDGYIITGVFSGKLFIWKGNSLAKTVDAHEGSLNCIYTTENLIYTGGNDGVVIMWDKAFQQIKKFKIQDSGANSMDPKVRSVASDKQGNILVGTRGSEIIEFGVKGTCNVYMRGHYNDELWGLACDPKKLEFMTAGEENLVAIWDIKKRQQKRAVKIDFQAKVAAYSPDGKSLGIGCKNGQVLILDQKTLKVTKTLKDSTKEISELKYSTNGQLLAVGSHDRQIYIYNTSNYSLQAKCTKHNATITHFDFSEDSSVLQSNCQAYELLFFDTSNGKQQTSGASAYKDEKWASWTCTIGWPVQGIWPPCSDGTDINSVDRDSSRRILVTGDDFGTVKLFKYPCPKEKASFNKYIGHSSHVTGVRFSYSDDYVISSGGGDKSIFQWKFIFDEQGQEQAAQINENDDEEEEAKNEEDQGEDGDGLFEEEQIQEGDQALAVKPFKGEVDRSWPTGYTIPKGAGDAPKANLTLKYVHGYRSFDARNVVKYNKQGNITYITAAIGVVMDPKTQNQSFFIKHEDDVISFAMHPKGQIAATGQMAAKGKAKVIDIFVWDIETKEVLSNLKGFHLRAIQWISFSPDGSKLLSFGQDDDNSLAVYDWAQQRLITTAKVDQAKVTAAAWKSESEFVSVGLKHIKFWTLNGSNIKGQRGSTGNGQFQAILCCTYAFDNKLLVTGAADGSLTVWSGASAGKSLKAHGGQVWGICSTKDTLYTGGQDGIVISWSLSSSSLKKEKEIVNITKISKLDPGIRGIDASPDKSNLVISTKASEIYEHNLKSNKSNLLIQGHYEGELWGLAVSPDGKKYATCGGDKTLRTWSIKDRKMLGLAGPLQNDLRAIDWAANNQFIVAGDMNGIIHLFSSEPLELLHSYQSSFTKKNQWIEDIKISPNSSLVAFGAHGGPSHVEIVKITDNKIFKKDKINAGLTSALTHLDWSDDCSLLAINSQAHELKFCSVDTCRNVASSSTKDVKWETWTCVFGFPVQGIWPGVDYTDVNSVWRANNQQILVTGDDFGKINLFKYPCVVTPRAQCKQFIGHSSHITRVRTNKNDDYVISIGGNDKSIFIWETDFGKGLYVRAALNEQEEQEEPQEQGNQQEEEEVQADNQEDEEDEEDEGDYIRKKDYSKKSKTKQTEQVQQKVQQDDPDQLFEEEEVKEGDQFLAVKPWLGQMKEPTGFKKPQANHDKKPECTLEIDYIYGYRAKDCRNNLRYLKDGRIVYHAAAVGIVLDQATNQQQFFVKHIDDITAFDIHPDGVKVVTGEIGPKPNIYVWSSQTMQVLHSIKGGIVKGCATLAFSPSGHKVAGAGIDDNHMTAVYDLRAGGALAGLEKGDTAIILDIKWISDDQFVSVGPKHYKLWAHDGKALTSKKGSTKDLLVCNAVNEGDILVGLGNGTLQIWKGNSPGKSFNYHKASLDSLYVSNDYVFTGGKDQVINVLDKKKYSIILTIQFDQVFPQVSLCPKIRSLCLSEDKTKLLVGTFGSEIYELQQKGGDITSGTKFKAVELMKGHYCPNAKWTNEVWGLDIFNNGEEYATCSDDATIRVWSVQERKILRHASLNVDVKGKTLSPDPKTQDYQDQAKGRCIGISPDDNIMVIGCKEGSLRVLDANSMKHKQIIKHRKEWISDIRYSPNGEKFAVGSHDNFIDIYNSQNYQKIATCKGHSSYITHLDWSEDSSTIHSNCGAYELLYWDSSNGKQLTSGASAFRDEKWATWTCVLGWPVQGIWPMSADGTDINAVDRTHKDTEKGYSILALGDDFGKVRLFRFPCLKKGADSLEGNGHSSHVTNVKFSIDDKMVYSTGGEDNCVFQWKITFN